MCNRDQHYVRDCPKQICQGCGEKGYYITKCGRIENAVMAVDILGRTSKDDGSDVEAYTTLEIKTSECLVSIMEKGGIRQMGDDLWLLGRGATGHFTYDSRLLENYTECSRVLRCAGGNTSPIVGTGTLRLSLRSGEGAVCVTNVNECCTCSRPFPPSSVAETYCRCGEQIYRYPRGHPNSLCKIRR